MIERNCRVALFCFVRFLGELEATRPPNFGKFVPITYGLRCKLAMKKYLGDEKRWEKLIMKDVSNLAIFQKESLFSLYTINCCVLITACLGFKGNKLCFHFHYDYLVLKSWRCRKQFLFDGKAVSALHKILQSLCFFSKILSKFYRCF